METETDKEVLKRKGESRKDYLLRVVLAYLEKMDESDYVQGLDMTLKYDGAECDGSCLIDDLKAELDID